MSKSSTKAQNNDISKKYDRISISHPKGKKGNSPHILKRMESVSQN